MHLSLSDSFSCPRCGPGHGLILLPDEVADRRVRSGVLGCPNCRERYPVEGGVADLRTPRAPRPGAGSAEESGTAGQAGYEDAESAVRLAALLGLAESRGVVLLAGPAAAAAVALARLIEDAEVVAATVESEAPPVGPELSSLRLSGRIPFQTGSVQAVALTGRAVSLLDEGARVIRPVGRLLLDPAPEDAADRVRDAGLEVLAEEGSTLVARRVGPVPGFR